MAEDPPASRATAPRRRGSGRADASVELRGRPFGHREWGRALALMGPASSRRARPRGVAAGPPAPLPQSFYDRDVLTVARELLGCELRRDEVVLRITEVEAYRWPGDTACHARSGPTARNAPLFGPPGRAYVYLCYGIHQMLNLVTGAEGQPAAVLVRSCEPVAGLEVVQARRGGKAGPVLLTGPGKVGQALALDVDWSFHPLYEPGGLTVTPGRPPAAVHVGPRVGIDYALPEHRALPWRFACGDTPWVTRPKELRPG